MKEKEIPSNFVVKLIQMAKMLIMTEVFINLQIMKIKIIFGDIFTMFTGNRKQKLFTVNEKRFLKLNIFNFFQCGR
jgi:hypothetical protein